jgi:hypothetical protein
MSSEDEKTPVAAAAGFDAMRPKFDDPLDKEKARARMQGYIDHGLEALSLEFVGRLRDGDFPQSFIAAHAYNILIAEAINAGAQGHDEIGAVLGYWMACGGTNLRVPPAPKGHPSAID